PGSRHACSSASGEEESFDYAIRCGTLKLPLPAWLISVRPVLPPEAELLDEGAVALEISLLQVLQQPAPAPDQLQQAAARIVVFRVAAQVLCQLVDACREERDLHV